MPSNRTHIPLCRPCAGKVGFSTLMGGTPVKDVPCDHCGAIAPYWGIHLFAWTSLLETLVIYREAHEAIERGEVPHG